MEPEDIMDESLEDTIQTIKQLIAQAERQLADDENAARRNRSDAIAC